METNDPLFEDMIRNFNFYKVREVMLHLDWKWHNGPSTPVVPTVAMMKEMVWYLYNIIKNKGAVESGGFKVTVNRNAGTATLSFILEESYGEV